MIFVVCDDHVDDAVSGVDTVAFFMLFALIAGLWLSEWHCCCWSCLR